MDSCVWKASGLLLAFFAIKDQTFVEKGRLFSLSAIELLTVSHLTWQPWQWRDFVSAGVARAFPAS